MGAVIDALIRRPGKQGPLWVKLNSPDGSISTFNGGHEALALPILVGGQDLEDFIQLIIQSKLLRWNSIMVQIAGDVLLSDPLPQVQRHTAQQQRALSGTGQVQWQRQIFRVKGIGVEHLSSA